MSVWYEYIYIIYIYIFNKKCIYKNENIYVSRYA